MITCIPCLKEILEEVSKREKEAGIVPDLDIDAYMKVLNCTFTSLGPQDLNSFSLFFHKLAIKNPKKMGNADSSLF